jgi:ABC-2 type transport system permease protein
MEIALTLRRGENVLVTLVVPIVLLVFFASTNVAAGPGGLSLDFLVPGILALAIISTGMVNLGIATAYERHYGVLKRLGGSPLPQGGLLVAKVVTILALEVVQVILVFAVAELGFGWQPHVVVGAALGSLLLGTIAFCGIGLVMAGVLRAEATLALANGLYLVFLLLGNVILPTGHLPALLQPVSLVLPATALSDVFRYAFGAAPTVPTFSVVALPIWAALFAGAAATWFKWD